MHPHPFKCTQRAARHYSGRGGKWPVEAGVTAAADVWPGLKFQDQMRAAIRREKVVQPARITRVVHHPIARRAPFPALLVFFAVLEGCWTPVRVCVCVLKVKKCDPVTRRVLGCIVDSDSIL